MRSKKWRFAFQRFTETQAKTPSILGCGITHQPHEGGDGAKFADTPHVIYVGVTGVRSEGEDPAELEFCHRSYLNRHSHRGRRLH